MHSQKPTDAASLSDNELASLAQRDEQHFTPLFDRFYKPVYRFFYFRLRNTDDAEDLTSETFQKVYKKLHTFRECGTPFSAWLFTIARNCLIDEVRKRKYETVSIDDLEPSAAPHTDFDTDAIDREMLSEKLWDAIRMLPQKYQDVWSLKLSSGLGHREIGAILGTTEGNISVMVHRSVALLKKRLPLPSSP